jgi:hypothetical protein
LRGVSTIYQFRALFDARNVSTNLDPIKIVHKASWLSMVRSRRYSGGERDRSARARLCRFSDAGVTSLSTHRGGRRPKSAKERNRGGRYFGGGAARGSSHNQGQADHGRSRSSRSAAHPASRAPTSKRFLDRRPVRYRCDARPARRSRVRIPEGSQPARLRGKVLALLVTKLGHCASRTPQNPVLISAGR